MIRWTALLLFCLTLGAAGSGCIRSRVMLTSEPSGAEVIWRGEPYGATPLEIPFIWYWHHHYVLEKPGFEKIEVVEKLNAPPWAIFPADLIMEIIPVPIHDTRRRHYELTPLRPEPEIPGEDADLFAPATGPGAPAASPPLEP